MYKNLSIILARILKINLENDTKCDSFNILSGFAAFVKHGNKGGREFMDKVLTVCARLR